LRRAGSALIESELFGHERGAFTGAERSNEGLLATAEGGTIFLNEIAELPIDLQAKLLRALQEKEIRPVGSTRRVPVNVLIVAAMNANLEKAIQQQQFRRDLYFRLNVLNVRIPALRDRRQDIELLAEAFLERLSRADGIKRSFTRDALRALQTYDWPGNVRELENCIERAVALSSEPVLHVSDLPRDSLRPALGHAKQRYGLRASGKTDEGDSARRHPRSQRGRQWRQAARRAHSRSRKNHFLSQTEAVRIHNGP
jgi:transcriptional regulator with PAS, ATPase and Fis domain